MSLAHGLHLFTAKQGAAMMQVIRSFARDESGATSIEYGAIAVLVSVIILVALNTISGSVQEAYGLVAAAFE